MEETTNKIKDYINEISQMGEQNPFDINALKKCFESFEFAEEELIKLDQITSAHVRRSEELIGMKNLAGAIVSMERAVEIHPLLDEYRNRMAQLYLMKSAQEGNNSKDRELAKQSASFSMKLRANNPIARNILKEIKEIEDKISGRHLNKKLILPFLGLILIIGAALLSRNSFSLPFLNRSENESGSTYTSEPKKDAVAFTEREVSTRVIGQVEDFEIRIDESNIAKTNGSFSYTLQGELSHGKSAVKSADINISFKTFSGETLFRKTFPLIIEDELILPGEPVLIDHFFYIHYLPPEIDKVDLSLSNLSLADEIPASGEETALSIDWAVPRPEGIKISLSSMNNSQFKGYGEDYINLKLKMENLGFASVDLFHVDLNWRDSYGEILHSVSRELIRNDNPELPEGGTRIFRIFTSLPPGLKDDDAELYIEVQRINS